MRTEVQVDRARRVGSVLVLAGGLLVLPLRLRLVTTPAVSGVVVLAGLYGALLFASLLVPAGRGDRRLPPIAVLGIGLIGLGLAAVVAGPSAPPPVAGAAVGLSVLAALAEEALFRRAAYAGLEPRGPVVAIGVTALLFAAVHVPLYGWAAFPVDLGAGLLFGWQRHASGSWSAPALTHVAANLFAVLR